MLKFLAQRKFNYIDTLSTGAVVVSFLHEQWIVGIAIAVVSGAVSVTAEHFAGVA